MSIHLAILNRAKAEGNPSIDLLGRLAVLKFIRTELQTQFARILEQCRMKVEVARGRAARENDADAGARFLISRCRKKIILRRAGPGSVSSAW